MSDKARLTIHLIDRIELVSSMISLAEQSYTLFGDREALQDWRHLARERRHLQRRLDTLRRQALGGV